MHHAPMMSRKVAFEGLVRDERVEEALPIVLKEIRENRHAVERDAFKLAGPSMVDAVGLSRECGRPFAVSQGVSSVDKGIEVLPRNANEIEVARAVGRGEAAGKGINADFHPWFATP